MTQYTQPKYGRMIDHVEALLFEIRHWHQNLDALRKTNGVRYREILEQQICSEIQKRRAWLDRAEQFLLGLEPFHTEGEPIGIYDLDGNLIGYEYRDLSWGATKAEREKQQHTASIQ